MSRAGVAAVLSFLVPGLGQVYNGDFFRALIWFVFAWAFFSISIFTMGIPSLLYHLWCAWSAYQRASERIEVQRHTL